jgi:hypothetical protein
MTQQTEATPRRSAIFEPPRRVAAREVLCAMKGGQGWIAGADDEALDFLATGMSQPMMRQLAMTWTVLDMGYPSLSRLAALTERLHLQAAVAALDVQAV